jgi:hypothetical protein
MPRNWLNWAKAFSKLKKTPQIIMKRRNLLKTTGYALGAVGLACLVNTAGFADETSEGSTCTLDCSSILALRSVHGVAGVSPDGGPVSSMIHCSTSCLLVGEEPQLCEAYCYQVPCGPFDLIAECETCNGPDNVEDAPDGHGYPENSRRCFKGCPDPENPGANRVCVAICSEETYFA